MSNQNDKIYLLNKTKKVYDICICPICGKEFIKKQYSQSFCSNGCKVKYHNNKQKGKRNAYYHKYNKRHPERILRIMPTLTARDRDNYDAMSAYLNDSDFRNYVNSRCYGDDEFGCNVELSTEFNNFYCID